MATATAPHTQEKASTTQRTVQLRVRRQDGPGQASYWQEFSVPYSVGMNVLTALMEIRKDPVTADGKAVPPVVWESSCL
jgi:succinate dehydrogenase / fumarate reductase iron-sulfur subunit